MNNNKNSPNKDNDSKINESIERNYINTKYTSNYFIENGIMIEKDEISEIKKIFCSIFNDNLNIVDENEEKSQQINAIMEGKMNKGEFNDINISFNEDTKKEKTFLCKKHLKENSINYTKITLVQNNDCDKFINKNKIFDINKAVIYRLDYYIKAIKANCLKYCLNKLRALYNKCNFVNEFKNMTFHMPNYNKYQGSAKEKANKKFIKKTIKEVFMDYEEKYNNKEGISRQIENKILIDKIYKINNFLYSKEQKELKDFLEMPIKKAIGEYYDSTKFEQFKKDRKIKFYDRNFYKEKDRNYSLLEKNGYIRLVKEPFYSHNPK